MGKDTFVAPNPEDRKHLFVAQVKWRHLSVAERKKVLRQLESKWFQCSLRAKYSKGAIQSIRRGYVGRVNSSPLHAPEADARKKRPGADFPLPI